MTLIFQVPDDLFKNEDRAFGDLFSINTTSTVGKVLDVKYLLARETDKERFGQVHIDDHLWEMLAGKMDLLTKLGLIKEDFMGNVSEVKFVPTPSNTLEGLTFDELSSGEESEYTPSTENEEDEDDNDSVSDDSEEISDDLRNSDDSGDGIIRVDDSGSENSQGQDERRGNKRPHGSTASSSTSSKGLHFLTYIYFI